MRKPLFLPVLVVVSVALIAGWSQFAVAAINEQLAFYGTLQDSTGTNLSGTYDMVFRFYDAASGGTLLDTSTHTAANGNAVTVYNGEFSVQLGSGAGNALDGIDFNSATIYVGLSVEGDPEMTPRERLTAAAYAFNADRLDGLDSTVLLRTDVVGAIAATDASPLFTLTQSGTGDVLNLFDGGTEVFSVLDGGNVGIGTTSPQQTLSVAGDAIITGALLDNAYSAGTNGQILQSTGSGFNWVATSSLNITASSLFTDSGALTYLSSTGDEFALGTSTAASAKLSVQSEGTSDVLNLFESGGSEVFTVLENGRVGIGTTSPVSALAVAGDGVFTGALFVGLGSARQINAGAPDDFVITDESDFVSMSLNNYSATDFHSPSLNFSRARGTDGSPATVQDGDEVMYINARPRGASSFNTGAAITGLVDGTPSGNNVPVELVFGTRDTAGTFANRLTIKADGQVGIGTSSPASLLDVYGDFRVGTSGTATLLVDASTDRVGVGTNAPFTGQLQVAASTTLGLGGDLWINNSATRAVGNYSRLAFGPDGSTDGTPNIGIEAIVTNLSGPWDSDLVINIFDGAYTEKMRLVGMTNFLGLGDATPDAHLEVSANGTTGGSIFMLSSNDGNDGDLFRVNENGNVGIGDNGQDAHLEVSANGGSGGAIFYLSSNDNTDGDLLTVLESGRVGISTTSPLYNLSVAGDAIVTGALYDNANSAGTNGQVLQTTGSGFNWVSTSSLGIGGGSSTFLGLTDTPGSFSANEIFYQTGATVSSSALFVFDGTNLGLGTTSPASLLDVYGDFRVGTSATSTLLVDTSTDQVVISNGTAASPSLTFAGNTNTGIYYDESGGQVFGFSHNGTQYLAMTASAIYGSQTGSFNLNPANGGPLQPTYGFLTDDNTGMFRAAADTLAFGTAGTERFRVDSDGNLQIGTTSALSARLSVQSTSTDDILNLFETGGTEVFTVLENGNVGIGTTTPNEELHIVASNGDGIKVTGGAPTLRLQESDTTDTNYQVRLADGALLFQTNNDQFNSAATQGIFDAAGNFGVGTSTPAEKLSVYDGQVKVLEESPELLGSIATNTTAGFKVRGDYLYALGGSELGVIDISDPRNPQLVGSTGVVSELLNASRVDVAGNYAYVAAFGDNSLTVVDVSNPGNPQFVTALTDFTNLGGAGYIQVHGNYVYLTAFLGDAVNVIDITNPLDPTIVDTLRDTTLLEGAGEFYIKGDYMFVQVQDYRAVQVIDISDPTNIYIASTLRDTTRFSGISRLTAQGNRLYLGAQTHDSLSIIDISDPLNLTRLATLQDASNFDSIQGLQVAGDYVYSSDFVNTQVTVTDVSSSTNPVVVGSISVNPDHLEIAGPYLYLATGTGLNIYQLASVDAVGARFGSLAAQSLYTDSIRSNTANLISNLNVGGSAQIAGALHIQGTGSSSAANSAQLIVGGYEGRDAFAQFGNTNRYWSVGFDVTDGSFRVASSSALGASDLLTLTAAGNFGIGTSSPAATLDVWGDAQIAAGSVATLFADTSQTRVGIGTSSPLATLDVWGSLRAGTSSALLLADASNDRVIINSDRNGTGDFYIFGTPPAAQGDPYGSLYIGRGISSNVELEAFQTGSDVDHTGLRILTHTSMSSAAPSREALRIDHRGNVDIGTADTNARLSVTATSTNNVFNLYASTTAELFSVAQNGIVDINAGKNGPGELYIYGQTPSAQGDPYGSIYIGRFTTSNVELEAFQEGTDVDDIGFRILTHPNDESARPTQEAFRIGHYGNTAIGTTTTNARLTVQATTTEDILNIFSTTGVELMTMLTDGSVGIGTTTPTTLLTVAGVITPDADNTFSLGNSSYRWSEVFAANGTINTSDARLKDNVKDISYGVDELLLLEPVTFTWKDNPEQGTRFGLIAQDVQKILPDIVNVGDDANQTLGIRYTELIAVVINAIQEMWDSITSNQAQISELERRIQVLEAELDLEVAESTDDNINASGGGTNDSDDQPATYSGGNSDDTASSTDNGVATTTPQTTETATSSNSEPTEESIEDEADVQEEPQEDPAVEEVEVAEDEGSESFTEETSATEAASDGSEDTATDDEVVPETP